MSFDTLAIVYFLLNFSLYYSAFIASDIIILFYSGINCKLLILSFLPEIRKSQRSRRLVFLFLSKACEYQYDNRYHIRQCFKYFLHASSKSRDIKIQNIKSSEQECSPDCIQWFHNAKITSATASQPRSPKPLSVQVPPEYSITK